MFNDKLDMNSFPKQSSFFFSSRIPQEMQIDSREHSTDREMTSPCQLYQKREVKLLIISFFVAASPLIMRFLPARPVPTDILWLFIKFLDKV